MKKPAREADAADTADTARLLHELWAEHLEVERQRVELEQQNEELRRATAEAAAARDHYAELYESAPVGYFTLDADGRISAVNRAGAALLGRPRGELVGAPLAGFVAPEQLAAYRDFLLRLIFPEGTETCTIVVLRPDGTRLTVGLEGRLDSAGHEFLVTVTDFTQRSRTEAALAAARDAAERANRAKSSFLANMSHEMRTPLHIIVGLGHLLRRDLVDTVQQQRIDQLCANSDHLLDLINDVLDLSRIEAGRLSLDRRPFRLADVVERLLGVIATPAQAKGLELALQVDAAAQDTALLGDPLRLAQILINLGSNAVKFTERGSIRIAMERLAETDDALSLRFCVQDSGIGIEPRHQERLFEPFFQADNSPTREHGGTGLGLAISQRLVHLMGGRIDVASRPGAGSRFSFALALPRAAEKACEPERSAAAADLGGRRVLFAEDHPLSQEILFEMLEDLGCEVDVASDGEEAVECARARGYDAILMDMQMPKMDGLAATQAIRQLPHHAATPIIALTANAFAEDRQRCLAAGMNAHLAKPVTPDTLRAALARWLPACDLRDPAAAGRNELAASFDIPGLHPPLSMCNSPQRCDEYRALLRRFTELHGDDMRRLRACLDAGERDDAHKLAHNLKGIAGLIGARTIAQLANDIVLALRAERERAEIAPLVSMCDAELDRLVAATAAMQGTGLAPDAGWPGTTSSSSELPPGG